MEVSEKRYRVELLSDDGVPRVPSLESVIEFLIGMSTGDVEKGGSREARDKDCACVGFEPGYWLMAWLLPDG